ncbi:MAG: peptide ABC transporter substrate-binding protein [Spirochaetales bacterium]|nr:peptide ABC transporter substrate-binding protein [Spirochaetales bacterium]
MFTRLPAFSRQKQKTFKNYFQAYIVPAVSAAHNLSIRMKTCRINRSWRIKPRLKKYGSALSFLILVLNTAAAFTADSRTLIEEKEFVLAMEREYIDFNPHSAVSTEMAQIFNGISEGLFSYHPQTMDPVPAIADSVDTDDFISWTIYIREGAAFSNGDPITADTFVKSWKALIDPSKNYEYASLLDIIKGVRAYRRGENDADVQDLGFQAKDSQTLLIELNSPAPYLLNILCHHSFSAVHPENIRNPQPDSPKTYISSGPFMVESSDSEHISMKQNPFYWDSESLNIQKVRVQFYNTTWSLIRDFQSGKIHWSMKYIDPAFLLDDNVIIGYPEYSTGFFYFSAVEGPYADPRIRKALALIIPWAEIRNSTKFYYPTDHLVPQTGSYNGVTGIKEQNLEKAFEILEMAGFPWGQGLPPIKIVIYPGELLEKVTRIIADTWEEMLNTTVTMEVKAYDEYIASDLSKNFDLQFLSWVGDFFDPFSFLDLWYSSSSFNLGNQYNPIYDTMIDKALKEGDTVKRYEKLKEAEQYLLDQATVLPIYHGVSINFFHYDIIGGWSPNLLNIHPFKYIYFRNTGDRNNGFDTL